MSKIYVPTWCPSDDGLNPDHEAWWLAHERISYASARRWMRRAHDWNIRLEESIRFKKVRATRNALDGFLFALDCARRERDHARSLRSERKRRFSTKEPFSTITWLAHI